MKEVKKQLPGYVQLQRIRVTKFVKSAPLTKEEVFYLFFSF